MPWELVWVCSQNQTVESREHENKFIADVKFASDLKNINFVFTHTPMCVSTVYYVLSRVL